MNNCHRVPQQYSHLLGLLEKLMIEAGAWQAFQEGHEFYHGLSELEIFYYLAYAIFIFRATFIETINLQRAGQCFPCFSLRLSDSLKEIKILDEGNGGCFREVGRSLIFRLLVYFCYRHLQLAIQIYCLWKLLGVTYLPNSN